MSDLQCPYVGCDKPNTVQQTSYGFNTLDMACANGHEFAVPPAEEDADAEAAADVEDGKTALQAAGLTEITCDSVDENGVRYYDARLDGEKVAIALGGYDCTIERVNGAEATVGSNVAYSTVAIREACVGAVALYRKRYGPPMLRERAEEHLNDG